MIYLVILLSLVMPTHQRKCRMKESQCARMEEDCFREGPAFTITVQGCDEIFICEQYIDECNPSKRSRLHSSSARAQLPTAQRAMPADASGSSRSSAKTPAHSFGSSRSSAKTPARSSGSSRSSAKTRARSSGSSRSSAKTKRSRKKSKASKKRRSKKNRKRGRKRSKPKPTRKPRRRRKPRHAVMPQRCINLQQLSRETFEATNRYRENEGADPLEHSQPMDAEAQGYADELMREITSASTAPIIESRHGVSLSFLQVEPGDVSQVTGQDVVQRWLDEIQSNDVAQHGNYTQLAWKNWKVVGHGFAADSDCSQMLSVAKYNFSDD